MRFVGQKGDTQSLGILKQGRKGDTQSLGILKQSRRQDLWVGRAAMAVMKSWVSPLSFLSKVDDRTCAWGDRR